MTANSSVWCFPHDLMISCHEDLFFQPNSYVINLLFPKWKQQSPVKYWFFFLWIFSLVCSVSSPSSSPPVSKAQISQASIPLRCSSCLPLSLLLWSQKAGCSLQAQSKVEWGWGLEITVRKMAAAATWSFQSLCNIPVTSSYSCPVSLFLYSKIFGKMIKYSNILSAFFTWHVNSSVSFDCSVTLNETCFWGELSKIVKKYDDCSPF